MKTGTVKWFNNEKGYGFLVEDGTNEEVFVHFTGINSEGFKTLEDNQQVTYDVAEGVRGLQATNVTVIKK
ncbi:cold-shock DNA-binding protein family [Granulicatella balaenopterae]|uniref:Cold-shock DNA-binding protein family n=1 Tax=Granulicatella balaenopterae TaxID=137733 RepID=A0A1H9IFI4_9LACT|nr:cold-shock protein [Granulicatella balaenopterae]SEQ73145.1 cold-shock DNA-binding protein family [Granulicatella balaenopterae]